MKKMEERKTNNYDRKNDKLELLLIVVLRLFARLTSKVSLMTGCTGPMLSVSAYFIGAFPKQADSDFVVPLNSFFL